MTGKPPLPADLVVEIEGLAPQLMAIDHYGVLSVIESSTAEEIKAAYLRMTKRFHPDRWAARDAGAYRKRMEAIFARATEAYEVLRDPVRKLDYDRSLYSVRGIPRASAAPMPPSAAPRPPMPPRPSPPSAPRAAPPPPPPPPTSPPPSRTVRAPTPTELAAAARLMQQVKRPSSSSTIPAVSGAEPAAPPPAAAPTAATSGKPRPRIIVAEDDETLRKMVLRVLQEIGDCEGAADGAIALSMVQSGPHPSLVVTDVMMPNMDGLELARRLKKDAKTSRIPIVMLTAKSGPKDMVDGVNAGARYYVAKPFKVEELKSRVRKALGLP